MKLYTFIFIFLCSVFSSIADLKTDVQAYMILNGLDLSLFGSRGSPVQILSNGDSEFVHWDSSRLGGRPAPTDYPENASEIVSNYFAQKEAVRQASKPLEQRTYENQFYALTEQLFNLTGVTNEVTPKLGFPELQAKIEQIQATDPMAAVNLSLKLLSIDAVLKRYNVLWWDDAIQHELPEE